jgi:hypothetical protein
MPKLDLARIKREVSFPALMSRYNFQLRPNGQNSFRGKCPLKTHSNPKDDNSFTATLKQTGWVWDCFSDSCIAARGNRKGGNVLDLVMLMESESQVYKVASMLNEVYALNAWLLNGNGSPDSGGRGGVPSPERKPAPEPPPTHCRTNKPLGFTLKDINPEHPLIQERGISVDTAKAFGVGFFPGKGSMAGRIVFPLLEALETGKDAVLVGYAGRSVSGQEPPWKLPPGLVKDFLYGLERCVPDKPLVVCESAWAVLWLAQRGQQAAALLGSELSEQQEACLAPFPTLILALDDDEAGHQKAEPIAVRLRKNHKVIKAFFKE